MRGKITQQVVERLCREKLSEQRQRLLHALRRQDIWQREDIEPFIDEMEKQAWQAQQLKRSWLNLEENYSKSELGLRSVIEVDTNGDNGGDEEQINKAIQKLGTTSGKISGRKQRKARELLEAIASASYYGYLVLRQKLGIPYEHPVLKPWYAMFLPRIPSLINPGGIILLKEGTFSISSPVLITKSYVKIEGSGAATILKSTGNNTILRVGDRSDAAKRPSHVTISDLRIDGSSQETATTNPENDDTRIGIDIEGPETKDIVVRNCYIYNTGSDGVYGYLPGDVLVTGCIIDSVRGYWAGIHPHGNHYWVIIGNIIHDCSTGAVRHGQVIAGNLISNCGGGYDFPVIKGSDTQGAIIGNRLYSSKYVGIRVGGNFVANAVIGNAILSVAQGYGIYLEPFGSKGLHDIIAHNIISDTDKDGIYFEGSCEHLIVEGNVIFTTYTGHGIRFAGIYCQILNNKLRRIARSANNAYDGIFITAGSTHNIIRGNYIYTDQDNKPRYCINEEDNTADYNVIEFNVLRDYATAALNIQGANSLARNNFGQNMKTVTADYSMIWADEAILADAGGGAITITLPNPASYPNYEVTIKKIDSSANEVTIAPHDTETIDGASSLTLANQNDAVRLRSDGTNWFSF